MGAVQPFPRERLIMGVLTTREDLHDVLIPILEKEWGPVAGESAHAPFSYTDYYDGEMGGKPVRYFLVFSDLVDPGTLADIKIATNGIEEGFAENGGRRINLDPGLLSGFSLILATTKNRSHRIPLQKGIYAETTLIYYKHEFHALPWTYADYASDAFRALFKEYRADYLAQLRAEKEARP